MQARNNKERSMLVSCLLSQIVWIISALILLLILCAISLGLDDPDRIAKPMCLAILYISTFIGGISAVKYSGDGIVSGALSGTITSIIVMLLSFLPFPESGFDTMTSVLCALLLIPTSVFGAILGHKKQTKKSAVKKMHRK